MSNKRIWMMFCCFVIDFVTKANHYMDNPVSKLVQQEISENRILTNKVWQRFLSIDYVEVCSIEVC